MNNKGSNIYINQQEMNVILLSEFINENPQYNWLKVYMNSKEKKNITKEDLEQLSEAQIAMLDGPLYKNLYESSSNEWIIEKHEDYSSRNDKPKCALCGESGLAQATFLRNIRNQNLITVGSTCITTYKDLKTVDGKSEKEFRKNILKQKRNLMLESKLTGIVKEIFDWNKYEDQLSVFVNKTLFEEYKNLYRNISDLYEKYLKISNNTKAKEISDKIIDIAKKGRDLRAKMKEYEKKHSGNEWSITPQIKKWCFDNGADRIITMLREDGKISFRTAYNISEASLMDKVLNKIKCYLDEDSIFINKINYNNNVVQFYLNEEKGILWDLEYVKIVDFYGERLFELPYQEVSLEKIIEDSKINEYTSLENAIKELDKLIVGTRFDLISEDVDAYKNEAYFIGHKENKYYRINLNEFVNNLKQYLKFDFIDDDSKHKIIEEILKGQAYTSKEYHERKAIFDNFKNNII